MASLRILGLDDDNHSPSFLCEDGEIFRTYKELVEFLSKPHDCQVEVRMFALVDDIKPTVSLANYEMEQVDNMFMALEGVAHFPEYINPILCFELFWAAANRQHW